MEEQLTRVVTLLRGAFGGDLGGAYLFGSATAGGLRPTSDLDVLGVLRRRTTPVERRRLIGGLLEVSQRPRHLEVTLVALPDLRPWRFPPRLELQYGDWWRSELEHGEEPWPEHDPDLAVLVTMVLESGRALAGPPAEQLLDPVPLDDVLRSSERAIPGVLRNVDGDTRNVLLTLARIWLTATTGEIRPKDEAADWALERLSPEHRAPLERARATYLAGDHGRWDELDVRGCAEALAAAAAANATRPLRTGPSGAGAGR